MKRTGIWKVRSNLYYQVENWKNWEDGKTYKLKALTHSYPYMVPAAVELLGELGDRFEAKLGELGIQPYYMMISSVLRTKESQNGLGRRNRNATTVSAHIYGTTFDISYKEFLPLHGVQAREGFCRHDMMRHAFGPEVLTEMSGEGRCRVGSRKKASLFPYHRGEIENRLAKALLNVF